MLKRWRGFPLQLFAFIILPLTILLVGIAFGSLALHQQAMRTLVGERDERATRATATAITEQLNHRAAAVHSLALQATATGDPEHTLADATSFLPDFEGGLAFFNADGTLLIATDNVKLYFFDVKTHLILEDFELGLLEGETIRKIRISRDGDILYVFLNNEIHSENSKFYWMPMPAITGTPL